jgi:hypothetical protein
VPYLARRKAVMKAKMAREIISSSRVKPPQQIEYAFLEHGYFLGRKFLVLAPSRSQVSKKAYSICCGSFIIA